MADISSVYLKNYSSSAQAYVAIGTFLGAIIMAWSFAAETPLTIYRQWAQGMIFCSAIIFLLLVVFSSMANAKILESESGKKIGWVQYCCGYVFHKCGTVFCVLGVLLFSCGIAFMCIDIGFYPGIGIILFVLGIAGWGLLKVHRTARFVKKAIADDAQAQKLFSILQNEQSKKTGSLDWLMLSLDHSRKIVVSSDKVSVQIKDPQNQAWRVDVQNIKRWTGFDLTHRKIR